MHLKPSTKLVSVLTVFHYIKKLEQPRKGQIASAKERRNEEIRRGKREKIKEQENRRVEKARRQKNVP